MLNKKRILLIGLLIIAVFPFIHAEEGISEGEIKVGNTLLWIAVILIAAKFSSLIERFGQPAVLGELIIGVVIGNLALIGINILEPIKEDMIIAFLAQLGVVILLFQIGLESSIEGMRKVGIRAFLVACVGVVVPFFLGTAVVGPLLMPGQPFNAYLFLGAILTATSVGITARVFKDLGKLQTPEAQIVLGAAVIDDVIGLVILAVVSAIVTTGSVGAGAITWISLKALLFLAAAIFIGLISAPILGRLFSRIHTGIGMKFTLAISVCLVFAFLAEIIGLAPIVGAFAAGLVLKPVHFRYFKDPQIVDDVRGHLKDVEHKVKEPLLRIMSHHADRHIQDLMEPTAHFLVPIFFVLTGIHVNLEALLNLPILLVALGITAAAFAGKIVSGLVAGGNAKKWIVGFGMIPRGEVGLIFAMIGKSLGVISDGLYSAVIIMVMITTLLTPPILAFLIRRQK